MFNEILDTINLGFDTNIIAVPPLDQKLEVFTLLAAILAAILN